ncbi:hemopexin repeat-containing protein [Flavimaricola marinus]|uniref:Hemopexin n=1 Tax=Flavimaricola marinus TaxID=1819565 RepID=A0A238LGB5_9RHOB|nr:hemopexin repeat-containing protein [Flavimaricola marinus]SMY08464.1 Hemopexin [Flavimaricola marinus]
MFDAAVLAPNGKHYFFAGSVYWRFDAAKGAVDDGYPLAISNWTGVPNNLDAAYRMRGGYNFDKIYFLKGRRVWRYDFPDGKVDAGYPKPIHHELKGFWDDGIDAAVDFGDYLRYVFRHNTVRQLDNDGGLKRETNPIHEQFPGVPGDLNAVVTAMNGRKSSFQFFQRDLTSTPPKPVVPADETAMMMTDIQSAGTNAVVLGKTYPGFRNRLTATQEQAVSRFAADRRPSKFPMLDRAKVAGQLRDRLSDPRAVHQINSAFCGPASIVYWLAKTRPDVYIKIVDELYHLGKFRTFGETITPQSDFLSTSPNLARVGGGQIDEIDWMVMGALRSARGLLTDVEGDGEEKGANAAAMKYWCTEVLGYGHVDFNRCYAVGEHKALEDADVAYNRHSMDGEAYGTQGAAFLAVHSSMLKGAVKKKDEDDGFFRGIGEKIFGNHWVVYEGDYLCDPGTPRNAKDGHFSFKVYSWGQIYHLSLPEEDFRNAMYGSVNAY